MTYEHPNPDDDYVESQGDPNHTWEDIAGEYATQVENLRAAILQHKADHEFAISRESKTREQMNRRKRAANERLWAAVCKPEVEVCGGQDPKFPGQACPLPKDHGWYGVGCFDEVSG